MNKKLLVVAIGAALAAPAFAQSSNVTLYGRINTAIESNKIGGDAQGLNGSETSMRSYSSRLGVRGVEDLGGGMKAVFGIETSLASDTGNGGLGNGLRNAYIGADTGNTGKLVLGRLDAAVNAPLYTQVFGVIDAIGYDAGAAGLANGDVPRTLGGADLNVGTATVTANNVTSAIPNGQQASGTGASNGSNTISVVQRKSNAIGYDVKVGQVAISARYQMAGTNDNTAVGATSATATGENNARNLELAANYKMGALTLGGGFEKATFSQVGEAEGKAIFDSRIQGVAGYDFGVAKVGATFARNKIDTNAAVDKSGNEYALSATVPMGKSAFVANYAVRDLVGVVAGDPNVDGKRKQLAVGVRHDLSVRTQAYALMNFTDASDKTNGNEARSIIAGLRHNF